MTAFYYVNTKIGTAGDGTTRRGDQGAANAFKTLASALSSIPTVENDLSISGPVVIKCTGNAIDNSQTNITGFINPDATNFITVTGDDNADDTSGGGDSPLSGGDPGFGEGRYDGDLDFDLAFYHTQNSSSGTKCIQITLHETVVEHMQVIPRDASNSSGIYAFLNGSPFKSYIRKNRIKYFASGNANVDGIQCEARSTGDHFVVENNISSNVKDNNSGRGILIDVSSRNDIIVALYNNTIANCDDGIRFFNSGATAVADIKNNTVSGCTVDFGTTAITINEDSNASEDSTNWPTNFQNVGNSPWTATYTDALGFDHTPTDASSVLNNNGVGNNADSKVPLDDIQDVVRDLTTPTIGAFEFGGGAPPVSAERPRVQIIG